MADRSYRPAILRAAIVLAITGCLAACWFLIVPTDPTPVAPPDGSVVRDEPPPDPRLVFDTPYRNVKPGVKYTGDASCAVCHPKHDASYHKHPMGRSADRVGRPGAPENYAANNPFTAQGYDLRSERTPSGDRHVVSAKDASGQPLPDHAMLATIAIGSGTRGRSYLAIEDSAVFQTPVSWYGQSQQRWDLSPSFDLGNGGRRIIQKECLYCHVNQVEAVAGSTNRIAGGAFPEQLNVGCERCHGPGELHVRERTDGAVPAGVDTSIVNPKHLSHDLRGAICQQCHLQGEERVTRRGRDIFEYRPGLPWDRFVSVFVRHPNITDYHKSVGQFDQMHVSKCFTGSGGKLDCTSCHDAHAKPEPAAADAFYRTRCQSCHESNGCKAPATERAAKADSCIACHMPKSGSSNIVHTAVTDHRVPRRPDSGADMKRPLPLDADPIVPFAPSRHAPPVEERERDLAIAFAKVIGKMSGGAGASGQSIYLAQAESRLAQSLKRWPGDAAAWDVMARLSARIGAPDRFLDAARKAHRLEPDSENISILLADALVSNRQFDEALAIGDRLVRLNPRLIEHRMQRARTLILMNDWPNAEAACREALAIHPLLPDAHLLLAHCRNRQGDRAGGDAALETAIRLATKPAVKADFRKWYQSQSR
jgi:Cytochrome c554 and c-prime